LFYLVTGGGGFLGRYVVSQMLARGDRVRSFSRQMYPALADMGAEQMAGDIRDADAVSRACKGVDGVVHTVAVAGIWGPWDHYYSINTQGTKNVVAGCRAHSIPRLVYTSSPSVTFGGSSQCGIDESAPYPTRWLCNYPRSKALAEQHVLEANGTDGLFTCTLRPHLIWGPGDSHLIPRLLERARQGRLRQVGDGTNLIDMIFIENAAQAHLQAMDALSEGTPVAGRAYFISQGEPVNCWKWINEILALGELPRVRKSLSVGLASKIGALCELAYWITGRKDEPPMTRFLASQLGVSHYFDISAAQNDFGYRATISTKEGMSRLADELARFTLSGFKPDDVASNTSPTRQRGTR